MDNKKNEIAINLQKCLYNNILPPPPKLCNSIISRVLESCLLDSSAADWSDSEHTKSSQERKDGRFRMTTSRHSERSEESTCDKEILRSLHSLRMTNNKTITKWAKTAAISLALSFFITAPAMAQDPVPVPTDNHAYTLTKVEQAGVNTITKYEWSDTENKYVPVNYRVDLKQTEYGYPEIADDTKTFTVTTPNADGSGNAFEYEIKYYVDSSRLAPDRITTEQNGTDINNDFVGLNVTTSSSAAGGAIYNYGTIGNITGDFIGNYASSSNSNAYGGAIYNNAAYSSSQTIIGDITGDFIGNYASSTDSNAYGGAIYNDGSGTIGDITGDFIGNYATTTYEYGDAFGGAIDNRGTITNITGDFIGNKVYVVDPINPLTQGGAIYNNGTIENITGNFISNSAIIGDGRGGGGAITNRKIINNITGAFIANYTDSTGGAINNYGTIDYLSADFIGNHSNSTGGAIGNIIGTIEYITGYFIGNHSNSYGGAIYNSKIIGDIAGDFIGNYASSTNSYASGGAIYNYYATIGNITGDFIGNYATSSSYAYGGAIYNRGSSAEIGDITGDFICNYAQGSTEALGGAIYNNNGTIGAKDNDGNVVGGLINSSFINNHATATAENGTAQGGAFYTNKSLNIIAQNGRQSVFSGNYVQDKDGKRPEAIYVENNTYAGNIKTEYVSVDLDKIIYQEKSSNFDSYADNPTLTLNANTNGVIQFDDQISGDNSNLVNNTYQMNIIGMAQDFSGKDDMYAALGLSDDATVSEVVDAYIDFMQKQYPDEPLPENAKELALQQFIQMGAIETSDPELISSESKGGYDLKITGDSTGKVILNNDIINANISLDNTNLYLGREDVFNQSQSLSLNSGSIYLNNQSVGTMHIPTLNLNGNTSISVDADLANKSMDRITADTYNVKDNAMLNVNNVVLLSDAKEDVTNILFADTELKGSVAYTGVSPIAYSPIYKYEVTYNPDDGFFTFARGSSSSGNPSDNYNPAVLAPSVTQQAGAYTTQLQTFNFAFQHADTFMNIPYMERLSIIEQGKYALSPTGDATDVGTYSPLMIKQHDPGFWVKPYASFENIPLKNGPKVSNINYGTLIGYDTPIKEISNGFERVLTGYIGYNGASQRYSGVDAYQNGGLLGGTATFYKGNFFNATTLSVGATAGDATTMYGSENYTMLLAGIGNKTGYNFEFFKGKMILQPNFLISYTFVNTFDYTNGAGVRIESDPLHAIQLSPGLKLIGNTKNGWQPYIGVNMVWNLLDDSKVTANDVRLPEMSIKPYVQYGVGIQKRFKDRFLAFGQAMIHNGGRNGVSLTAGLRWKIGKE